MIKYSKIIRVTAFATGSYLKQERLSALTVYGYVEQ